MTSSRLLTSGEVATRLGIARQTVTWRVARGQLTPAQKLPGARGGYLFTAEHIDEVAAEQAAALTDEARRLTAESAR
ncbi:helix-turn-helix transcriptional regulator [Brachybacterium tyrofermentans]|uniref:helix-turn-helix transcriptional regulator n=1 Tax=Brachybacterium tyrofermentans TaxID=47848 RepID=UPI003FD0C160